MARHTRSSAPAVNLFPFLAVLLCMMGALVFLLIALSSKVGIDPALVVEQPPVEEPEPLVAAPLPSFDEPLEPEIIRPPLLLPEPVIHDATVVKASRTQVDVDRPIIERLEELRAAIASESERRSRANVAADQMASATQIAQQKKASLEEQLAIAKRNRAAAERGLNESQKLISQSVSKLSDVNDDLEKKATQPRARQTKFRLLPYDRTTGTQRYPIVVECNSDGFRFAIEDIGLDKNSFRGRTMQSNPLIDGVDELTSFYSRRGERPYVLLVVRPDGIDAFRIARGILQKNRRRWGYELLPADLELDWPVKTPGAIDALLAALTKRPAKHGEPLHKSGDIFAFAEHATVEDRIESDQRVATRRGASEPGQGRGSAGSRRFTAANPPNGSKEFGSVRRGLPYDVAGNVRPEFGRLQTPFDGSQSGLAKGAREQAATRYPWSNQTTDESSRSDRPSAADIPARLSSLPVRDTRSQQFGGSESQQWGGTPAQRNAAPTAQALPGDPVSRNGSFTSRRWGKQSPDQWIGYERRVEVVVEGDRMSWGDASIDGISAYSVEMLSEAIGSFLDVVAADWEAPRRTMHWRPTLVATGSMSRLDSKLMAACKKIDVGFKREAAARTVTNEPAPSGGRKR